MLSHGWQGFNDAAARRDGMDGKSPGGNHPTGPCRLALQASLINWPPVGCATTNKVVPRTNTIDGLVGRSPDLPEQTGVVLRR